MMDQRELTKVGTKLLLHLRRLPRDERRLVSDLIYADGMVLTQIAELTEDDACEYQKTFAQIYKNTGSIEQARNEVIEQFVSEWLVLTDSGESPNDYYQPELPISQA